MSKKRYKKQYKAAYNTKPGKKTSGFKKFCIGILAIFTVAVLGIDGWAFYIHKWGQERIVSKTAEIGLQTLADGTTEYVWEVNLYTNQNRNGLQMFEVKWNTLLDENKTQTFSQGYQYTSTGNIAFDLNYPYHTITNSGFANSTTHQRYIGYYQPSNGTSVREYQCDGDTSTEATAKLTSDSRFKIGIGNETYMLGFKKYNANYSKNEAKLISEFTIKKAVGKDYYKYFLQYDAHYISYLMYNAVKGLPAGTSRGVGMKFEDMFKFYKYDETNKRYDDEAVQQTDKLIADMSTYAAVKVNVYADGVRKAEESLFGQVNGNYNYNTTGDYSKIEYYYGKPVIEVKNANCKLIETDQDNHFKLGLSEKFIKDHDSVKKEIVLDIIIDKTFFDNLGITIDGFVLQNGYTAIRSNLEVIN